MNHLLSEIYSNHRSPGGLASQKLLLREARKRNKDVTAEDVRKFLHSNETYTKFYKGRSKIETNMVLSYLDTKHYMDLAFFTNFRKQNKGFAYLLVVVDSFSRFIMARVLKTKECREVAAAYRDILTTTQRIPVEVISDMGGEFLGKPMRNIYEHFRIKHRVAKNTSVKAAMAESSIFRIKNKMLKYFSSNKTYNWSSAVNGIVESLNLTYIHSIGTCPANVTHQNAEEVFQRLYKRYIAQGTRQPKFSLNSIVRVSHGKQGFRKGTESRYTDELFRVKKIINYPIPVYILESLKTGEEIDGIWYSEELVEFLKDTETFPIQRVIRKRKRNGENEFLVKFKGYKELYWIPARDLQNE